MFEENFPNITYFVDAVGYIEIGYDEDSPLTSFIRAIDPGGMVWESADTYNSIEEALQALESALGEWMEEVGIMD